MKKTMILGMAVTAIATINHQAIAADEQYPATNFQPKIIYQDDSVSQNSAPAAMSDSEYPAAYFQPKVIYQSDESITAAKQAVEFDPDYPAAYFQPKKIYP